MGLSNNHFSVTTFSVADTLLWRDKKQTLTTLLVLAAIYLNFVAPGYTIITAVSKLLLVASIFLFIHGKSPQKMYVFAYSLSPSLTHSKFAFTTVNIYKYSILFCSHNN